MHHKLAQRVSAGSTIPHKTEHRRCASSVPGGKTLPILRACDPVHFQLLTFDGQLSRRTRHRRRGIEAMRKGNRNPLALVGTFRLCPPISSSFPGVFGAKTLDFTFNSCAFPRAKLTPVLGSNARLGTFCGYDLIRHTLACVRRTIFQRLQCRTWERPIGVHPIGLFSSYRERLLRSLRVRAPLGIAESSP